ncbi:Two-component hybrid sensor and regulator [Desulfamplus magnetovallimortis]|uniref:histidine kinase n=1 Tax=Desulfamplus magnetovallimortis TaxID=1246637 RepID=A0A1W1HH28_9BACT|nr:hybrid sensor histidine kinase/response regulator [Desulfamplus magnetovallimortis]SLM31733.1 Two-component hybrid sensor and regulator [Desulfamplus magnetovallimortis]
MTKDRKKPTVLAVDDVQENIEILLEILDDMCEVAVALDGFSALEIAFATKPDLILLDIMMPEMDGYEVCRRLKQDKALKKIPIIFITALDSSEDESRGLAAGAIDYITKPFNPDVVKARVKNHLALYEASKLREDMEQIMRHDLKNPLMSIINVPQLIMMIEEKLSPQSVELLEQIEASGQKLLSMINLSLDTFKMEQGFYYLQPVRVELVSLLNRIIKEQCCAIKKRAEILMTIDGKQAESSDTFGVSGESLLCYTMFSNLLKNAIEATRGKGRITITLKSVFPRQISIHNPGAVPEDIRNTFFEKYATSGKKGGTGLGTYSAFLIAQTLGGTIQMKTSEDTGTLITVFLPVFDESPHISH